MRFTKSKVVLPVFLIGCLWLFLAAGDWFLRFEHFHWQDRLMTRPKESASVTRGPYPPLFRQEIPPIRGGDLTRLAAVDDVVARYGETKPETLIQADEAGYRNDPPTVGKRYPVMVVGDSFMNVKFGKHGSFPELLAVDLGVPVYNHAYPGSGAFWGLHRYLLEGRFIDRPPKVIVWGLLEREIAGGLFSGYVYHLRVLNKGGAVQEDLSRGEKIAWDQLKPAKLKTTLPNTSYFSAAVNRAWNIIRYRVFGSITKDVVVSKPDRYGNSFLFYHYNLESMAWSREQRNLSQAAYAVAFIRDALRTRGSELVVVLIPDKEQVYRELIPDNFSESPPCTLIEFEEELRRRNLPVINLFTLFREQAATGPALYWRDDTHWKPEAMAMAARLTAERIRGMQFLDPEVEK